MAAPGTETIANTNDPSGFECSREELEARLSNLEATLRHLWSASDRAFIRLRIRTLQEELAALQPPETHAAAGRRGLTRRAVHTHFTRPVQQAG